VTRQVDMFLGSERLQMNESIQLTIDSLNVYGPRHDHWAIAWSGGKDSTTLLTLVVYLIESGKVPRPKTLTVMYADTRLELLPLWVAARSIIEDLRTRGIDVRIVMAPMDKRFLVYMLGRGVPPPNNNTLRWCTRQIKIDPMAAELGRVFADRGTKVLMLTGVRQGESAIRDGRIAMSCSRDGAECGQGWYQETLPEALCDTLAPIVHWRVCHVWAWLRHWAPQIEFGDWDTEIIADAYGGDEAEEINARTGCVGCPLAEHDTALDAVLAQPAWSYLTPLKRLRPLWRELRKPAVRLRKRGLELRQDGTPAKNPQRMGPVLLDVRLDALEQVLAIQAECNTNADAAGRPRIDILNADEETRVRQLIAAGQWPDGWDGDEAIGDELLEKVFADGSVQPLLPMFPTKEPS
jgi:DNA sulfur modification protein DndC